ncbi:hypothetical protein ONZ45_g3425 [Pleurotus djamor]|nr:hypothetical protein ONZ45_g3425 [Pleurotus djamor]
MSSTLDPLNPPEATQVSLGKRADVNLKLALGLGISLVGVLVLLVAFSFLVFGFYLGHRRGRKSNGFASGGSNTSIMPELVPPPGVPWIPEPMRQVRFAQGTPTTGSSSPLPIIPPAIIPQIPPDTPNSISSPVSLPGRRFSADQPNATTAENNPNHPGYEALNQGQPTSPAMSMGPGAMGLPMTPSAYVQLPPQSPFPSAFATSRPATPYEPGAPWTPPSHLPPTPRPSHMPTPAMSMSAQLPPMTPIAPGYPPWANPGALGGWGRDYHGDAISALTVNGSAASVRRQEIGVGTNGHHSELDSARVASTQGRIEVTRASISPEPVTIAAQKDDTTATNSPPGSTVAETSVTAVETPADEQDQAKEDNHDKVV